MHIDHADYTIKPARKGGGLVLTLLVPRYCGRRRTRIGHVADAVCGERTYSRALNGYRVSEVTALRFISQYDARRK